jgi:hypothetical protein
MEASNGYCLISSEQKLVRFGHFGRCESHRIILIDGVTVAKMMLLGWQVCTKMDADPTDSSEMVTLLCPDRLVGDCR